MLTLTADRGYELFMPLFSKLSSQPQKQLNQLQPDSLKTDKNQKFFTPQTVSSAATSLSVPPNMNRVVVKWGVGGSCCCLFDPAAVNDHTKVKVVYKPNPVKNGNLTSPT